ncbi:MAG: hypothetical protein G01um101431_268 [Parcubacteria group bacterium Gr01-1014_31]|nr:MAG: hypothetical protein G01um101431_268 [Parcubacteria group bacterium Gr01-1014_31]
MPPATPRRIFEQWISQAVAALPDELRARLENVAFVLEDDDRSGRYLGLYHGVPKPHRTLNDSGVLPDKITIFQTPIEREADSPEALPDLVRLVVWHEIGHYFGFSERRVRQMEHHWAKRLKTRDHEHH